MTKSSDHGYTEDDVRIVAESLRFAATEPYGDLLMNADRAAGLAVAALAAAGRLRDTRDHATDFAAVSGYDLGIEEGRRQMEVELRAGRLLPADTRTDRSSITVQVEMDEKRLRAAVERSVATAVERHRDRWYGQGYFDGQMNSANPNPAVSPDTKEEPDATA